jgi:hypothetical protein
MVGLGTLTRFAGTSSLYVGSIGIADPSFPEDSEQPPLSQFRQETARASYLSRRPNLPLSLKAGIEKDRFLRQETLNFTALTLPVRR